MIRVGSDYSVAPTLKIAVAAWRKVRRGLLCGPNLPYAPVDISEYVEIGEGDEILVYI